MTLKPAAARSGLRFQPGGRERSRRTKEEGGWGRGGEMDGWKRSGLGVNNQSSG